MPRLRAQDGFTLIEVLMVIVIAGILLAIALPSFLGQKEKATDVRAKSDVRNAELAMETYRSEHDGSFACGTSFDCVSALREIEPTLPESGLTVTDEDGTGSAVYGAFRITALGGAGREFWIARRPGDRSKGCALNGAASPGGCRVEGTATSGRW